MKRPRARRMAKLYDRLVELGHQEFELRWESIGPALEMCGHSGGYILKSEETEISVIPLGLSLEQALRSVELWPVKRRP